MVFRSRCRETGVNNYSRNHSLEYLLFVTVDIMRYRCCSRQHHCVNSCLITAYKESPADQLVDWSNVDVNVSRSKTLTWLDLISAHVAPVVGFTMWCRTPVPGWWWFQGGRSPGQPGTVGEFIREKWQNSSENVFLLWNHLQSISASIVLGTKYARKEIFTR